MAWHLGEGSPIRIANSQLMRFVNRHALEFGCHWNRDIGKIIEESGLEIVKLHRKHLGTTWWIELKPRRKEISKDQA
jgi:methyltransferase OMS1, mitochondrial